MPNNPVQIILNDQDFHAAPDPGQAPRNKDFFDGADAAFAVHRSRTLLIAIDGVYRRARGRSLRPCGLSPGPDARRGRWRSLIAPWAGFYRPTNFRVSVPKPWGTLYFRAPLILPGWTATPHWEAAEGIWLSRSSIASPDGEPYKAPTAARAEVGAIRVDRDPRRRIKSETFQSPPAPWRPSRDPRAVSGYHVELFETPRAIRSLRTIPALGRIALRRSLEQVLLSLGAGATPVT